VRLVSKKCKQLAKSVDSLTLNHMGMKRRCNRRMAIVKCVRPQERRLTLLGGKPAGETIASRTPGVV
jgi:hypothetical protein